MELEYEFEYEPEQKLEINLEFECPDRPLELIYMGIECEKDYTPNMLLLYKHICPDYCIENFDVLKRAFEYISINCLLPKHMCVDNPDKINRIVLCWSSYTEHDKSRFMKAVNKQISYYEKRNIKTYSYFNDMPLAKTCTIVLDRNMSKSNLEYDMTGELINFAKPVLEHKNFAGGDWTKYNDFIFCLTNAGDNPILRINGKYMSLDKWEQEERDKNMYMYHNMIYEAKYRTPYYINNVSSDMRT